MTHSLRRLVPEWKAEGSVPYTGSGSLVSIDTFRMTMESTQPATKWDWVQYLQQVKMAITWSFPPTHPHDLLKSDYDSYNTGNWSDVVWYTTWIWYIPEKLIVASRVLMMADAPVVATPMSRSLSPNSSPNEGSIERVESWKSIITGNTQWNFNWKTWNLQKMTCQCSK
jgi:hypothetical protein